MGEGWLRDTFWKNWRGASTITPGIVHTPNSKFNSTLCDGRFRLSIPTVSVRVSLPLRARNRIPVEYTTLYSSIPRLPATPPLLPTRFPRKPHQPPPRRIHLHLSSIFSYCNSYWFSEKSEMPVCDAYWFPCMPFALLSELADFFRTKWQLLTLRSWLSWNVIALWAVHIADCC